jgi:predicted metal-dependent HD superfamily phosphohydrolase
LYRATNGQLLTNIDQVLSRWREYFEQNLNESSEEEPHTNQEPARENDVIIDLPNREEIFEAIRYLKDNKAAGLDSIAAELSKSGRPSLVNALNEMIQQVWIRETHIVKSLKRINCTQKKFKFNWKLKKTAFFPIVVA